jgi:hypothetical protein
MRLRRSSDVRVAPDGPRVTGVSPPFWHGSGMRLCRPVPLHAVQIVGMQVCALPSQAHPCAGARPPSHIRH